MGYRRHFFSFVLLGFSLGSPLVAKPATRERPRLVVMLVVDQMRFDYLERFDKLFSDDGFRWLQKHGALFTNANYEYVPTFTAPGHASIATGSVPSQHGIVANTFYDRATERMLGIVADEKVSFLRSPQLTIKVNKDGIGQSFDSAASPHRLKASSLGDQLRLTSQGRSRVVGVALKDRSAILSAGLRPTGAYWFDTNTGSMVSSTYYGSALPAWVNTFNTAVRPEQDFGQAWDLSPATRTFPYAQVKNMAAQLPVLGKSFPYVVGDKKDDFQKNVKQFELSPFANDYVVAFAKAAMAGEKLGARGETDLLAVSFSTPDMVGHAYGPDSLEIAEMYVRLDRSLANLLAAIRKQVPDDRLLIGLSADHGVSPVPEYLASSGYPAGKLDANDVSKQVNAALVRRFGSGKWVKNLSNDQLYLDTELVDDKKLDHELVEKAAGDAALQITGIANYLTRSQLGKGQVPATAMGRRAVLGFHRKLSGDVLLVTEPFWFFHELGLAATHGSSYHYDTHVPVLIAGPGVKPGRYATPASPSDIAPTLAELLRIEAPNATTGRVLTEALP